MERKFHIGQTVTIQSNSLPSHVPDQPSMYCYYNTGGPMKVIIDHEGSDWYVGGELGNVPTWYGSCPEAGYGHGSIWFAETDCMEYAMMSNGQPVIVNVDNSMLETHMYDMKYAMEQMASGIQGLASPVLPPSISSHELEELQRVMSHVGDTRSDDIYYFVKDNKLFYPSFREAFLQLGFKNTQFNPPMEEGTRVKGVRAGDLKSTGDHLIMIEDKNGRQGLIHSEGVRRPSKEEKVQFEKIFKSKVAKSDTLDELVVRSRM